MRPLARGARALLTRGFHMATKTGQYTGNGSTTQVATGLVQILSLQIVEVAARGPSAQAYTTNAIQSAAGAGTFLNGQKRDSGIAIERGTFTVTSADFNVSGTTYFWDADGD